MFVGLGELWIETMRLRDVRQSQLAKQGMNGHVGDRRVYRLDQPTKHDLGTDCFRSQ